ncbi:MAG: hypothetical protein KDC34_13290 [Saprospiraceae bacterium]|nr:hypothetical protein [Saprospiraceae bacterium]
MNVPTPSPIARIFAWSVHIFTATGLLAGFMAILAIVDHEWQEAAYWLLAALLIDGVDGTFARMARVREVLPNVDGKSIDYVIDFANYAIIPAFFLYESNLIFIPWNEIAVGLILLVSALYYGLDGMVSEDQYFVGFPVMWNMVVLFQVFVFQVGSALNFSLVVLFAILHFVPVKFAYPSQNKHSKVPTILVTIFFIASLLAAIYYYPTPPVWCKILAVLTVAYYAGLAVYDTFFRKQA